MKKTAAVFLAAVTVFASAALSACNKTDQSGSGTKNDEPEATMNTKWCEDLPVLTFSEAADEADWVDTRAMNNEAKLLLSSLKAVVNSTQPRIYTYESENGVNWLPDLGYTEEKMHEYTDICALTKKYASEISGAVIYDPQVPDTINLACSYAGWKEKTLVCSPIVLAMLEGEGVKLNVVKDFRNQFTDKYSVYEWMYENLWGELTHKVITCLNYENPGYVRDYAIAAKSAIVWMSTAVPRDVEVMKKFFSEMTPGESAFMGWFPEGDEAQFVALSSQYGILTYPSDLSENLTFLSGAMTPAKAQYTAVPQQAEKKIYVSFIVSDGDNLQYHQHEMRKWWQLHNSSDPEFSLTWTFNPSAYVIQPAIMDYYFKNAGSKNAFMTGPSGLTYNYPRNWQNAAAREKIFALTNKYCSLSGIGVVNNWMAGADGYGELTEEEIATFGKYYKDILAVYDQVALSGGARQSDGLLVDSLSVNYSQVGVGTGAFIAKIAEAIDNFAVTGEPQFVSLQGNPWDKDMYENFKKTYNTFKGNANIKFVGMDELAMAQRLYMNLPAAR